MIEVTTAPALSDFPQEVGLDIGDKPVSHAAIPLI